MKTISCALFACVAGFSGLCAMGACQVRIDLGGNAHPMGTEGTGGEGPTGSTGGMGECTPGAMVACYDGSVETAGVGLCKPGSKTCAPDGMNFGPCEGEILPVVEDCATPVDDDCDGTAPHCNGDLSWARRFGNEDPQTSNSVAVDATGNVILVGDFSGFIDFGGNQLVGWGVNDTFVVKLSATGVHLWSRRFGGLGSSSTHSTSVAVDLAGNILVTGSFRGAVDFGSGVPLTSAGGSDVFVAKLAPDSSLVWSKRFGDAADQEGTSIAADPKGNVLVTGFFSGKADFGGAVPLTSAGGRDVFIAKVAPDGSPVWSKRFGDAMDQKGASIATDLMGNVLVTGSFRGAVDFGGGLPLTSAGGSDGFVAKLAPDSSFMWSKAFGDTMDQEGTSIAADPEGNVLVTGFFFGKADFGGGVPLTSAGESDIFVAKLAPDSSPVWSKAFGDAAYQEGTSIAADPKGNVLVTGFFYGKSDFDFGGGVPLTSPGGSDAFVAKLAPDSSPIWSKGFGGDAADPDITSIAVDPLSNVLVTGSFFGTVDLGGGPLNSAGISDVLVAKLAP